jgi:ankyrin repeat protein
LFDAVLHKNAPQVDSLIPLVGTKLDDHFEGYTALEVAFHYQDPKPAQLLLEAGASLEVQYGGRSLLAWAICSKRLSVAKRMIQADADVNARDSKRRTPLHYAAKLSNPDYVRLLIERGVKLCAVDNKGEWPFHKSLIHNNVDTMRLLMSYLPLDPFVLYVLLEWSLDKGGVDIPVLKELVGAGAPINKAYLEGGKTLLHNAVAHRNEQRVRILLALGADPSCADDDGQTPWTIARKKGYHALAILLEQAIDAQQLGIDPSQFF